ncbi:hypothetical protein A3D11_00325 [Candidatus Peribacteria bacterium RIFCSPHIGHO2_02_FULL_49_16]|nr:MAG: hypothetical protein A2880_02605 [Candidatus Peribacteria bacterium RIFCSPHIGHO2_01_FULL_49_38]OGJ59055.1 MAG: hypothetical protein A3D11_00325 [Candidatus Peribacteria bacterium RIFCSPHIGHO2_02_FULL_49_16]
MTYGIIEILHPQTLKDATDTLETRIKHVQDILDEEGLVMSEKEARGDKIRFEGPKDALIKVLKQLIHDNILHRLEIENLHSVHESEMGSDGG